MKIYFDDEGVLRVDTENATDTMALRYWINNNKEVDDVGGLWFDLEAHIEEDEGE